MRWTWLVAVFGIAVAFIAGYEWGQAKPGAPKRPAVDPGPTVATFAGGSVTTADLKAYLAAMGPLGRQRAATPEGRKELIRELVRQRLLVKAAYEKGLDEDPDVVRQHERVLTELYLRKDIEEPIQKESAPGQELDAYVEKHKAELYRPTRLRVADLFVAAPPDAAGRAERRKHAMSLLKEAKEKSAHDVYGFSSLARAKSDDASSRPMGGELPFFDKPELVSRFGEKAADELLALPAVHTLLDQVVETKEGFHLLYLFAKESEISPSPAQLKAALGGRWLAEHRNARKEEALHALEEQAQVRIDDQALSAAVVAEQHH